ncbi:MAG: hypothetical protein Q4B48_06420 [Syntrophomonadaceae bacterium]|nr:hypothetical protein [Syntrophomonadaceae bacterium]
MALKKAVIKTDRKSGDKEISVLFNPAEYSINDSANYADKDVPGLGGPITQFVSGAASTLTMTLYFDTYETDPEGGNKTKNNGLLLDIKPTDVSLQTKKVAGLTRIDGKLHRPPICTFQWGKLSFRGVVKSVNQTYTMFMDDGMPVRARVEVTFQSVLDDDLNMKESPFESPDRTKRRTIREGMQLWNLAWEEYGDPELWRVIAQENGMMNPLRIQPGQVVKLPAL